MQAKITFFHSFSRPCPSTAKMAVARLWLRLRRAGLPSLIRANPCSSAAYSLFTPRERAARRTVCMPFFCASTTAMAAMLTIFTIPPVSSSL